MRALLPALIGAAIALPAPARDLGTLPFSGQMAIEWIAREDDGSGGFSGRYAIRGGLDDEGGESLFAGFALACQGTLAAAPGRLVQDGGVCRLTDRHGSGATLRFTATPGEWNWHLLSVSVSEGTGPYVRVRGSGVLIRAMHAAPESASPWGLFTGSIAWRLD